jgi:hypothetical protein
MAIKFLQNQDLGKLESAVNKTLAEAKGGLRFRSLTTGQGMYIAVLESAAQPKPATKPATKSSAEPATKPAKTKR